jgi:hypothetical protein
LDSLGFPWILSSESGLFNGLRSRKRGIFFLSPFSWHSKRWNASLRPLHAEAQDCSWGKLNLISDFLQEIAARVLPLEALPSKSKSLEQTRQHWR